MFSYRADIDGLRAVAVLAVIFFHASLPGWSGGFVGVDIFFVISGFLISSIILAELEADKFSVRSFYERRIRRIFPPLFVMLAASWIAAYYILLPLEFRAFGKNLLQAALFGSNVGFWLESGYFDADSDSKPLLHTWSLCVEEQFYFVFPLLLWAVLKYRRRLLPHVLLALFVLSFGVSVWGVQNQPEATFFLAHTRAWELFTGVLLSLRLFPAATTPLQRNLEGLLGAGLLVYAITSYTSATPFPGLAAVAPCLGAALIIHAGASGTHWVGKLLSLRGPVFVGLLSYSLYLWHWPLLVFARKLAIRPLHPDEIARLLAATAVLALLSRYLLEEPVRRKRLFASTRSVFAGGGLALAAASILGVVTGSEQAFAGRVPPELAKLELQGNPRNLLRRFCVQGTDPNMSHQTICDVGVKGRVPEILVWGDSHASALGAGFSKAAQLADAAVTIASRNTCVPLLGVQVIGQERRHCAEFNEAIRARAADARYRTVVLAGRWAPWMEGQLHRMEGGGSIKLKDDRTRSTGPEENQAIFRAGLERSVKTLKALGKRVVIMASTPEIPFHVPSTLARILWTDRNFDLRPRTRDFLKRQARTFAAFEQVATAHGAEVLYPHKVFCGDYRCKVERKGKALYQDFDHVNEQSAWMIAEVISGLFERSQSSAAVPAP